MSALVIYCDASAPHPHSPDDTKSGWGAVFVRDGKVVGEAKETMARMESVVAELKAARYALEHAVRHKLCSAGETVIVASDCDAVERLLSGRPSKVRPRVELVALAEGVARVAVKADLTLVATWVKGHAKATPVHGKHNARADRLAREASGAVAARQRKAAESRRANDERQRAESDKLKAEKRAEAEKRKREALSSRELRFQRIAERVAQLEGRS
jgi:ribonuclease HI